MPIIAGWCPCDRSICGDRSWAMWRNIGCCCGHCGSRFNASIGSPTLRRCRSPQSPPSPPPAPPANGPPSPSKPPTASPIRSKRPWWLPPMGPSLRCGLLPEFRPRAGPIGSPALASPSAPNTPTPTPPTNISGPAAPLRFCPSPIGAAKSFGPPPMLRPNTLPLCQRQISSPCCGSALVRPLGRLPWIRPALFFRCG